MKVCNKGRMVYKWRLCFGSFGASTCMKLRYLAIKLQVPQFDRPALRNNYSLYFYIYDF
jgi:hypothetical protein